MKIQGNMAMEMASFNVSADSFAGLSKVVLRLKTDDENRHFH